MLAFVRRFLLYYAALVFVACGLFLIISAINSKNKVIFSSCSVPIRLFLMVDGSALLRIVFNGRFIDEVSKSKRVVRYG